MTAISLAMGAIAGTIAVGPGCSDATPQPPVLADCVPKPDAACRLVGGGGAAGGGGGKPDGAVFDSPFVPEPDAPTGDDGGACSSQVTADLAPTPACQACVAAGQDAGSSSCCIEATSCAQDPTGCLHILECALTCTAGASCPVQSCADFEPAASVLLYDVLANCMNGTCAGSCPTLSTVSADD